MYWAITVAGDPRPYWDFACSSLNVRVNGIGGYICIAQCTQAIIMSSDAAQHWHWWCAEVSMMLSAEMSDNFINCINASIARWEMNASMIGTTIEQAWCKIIVGWILDVELEIRNKLEEGSWIRLTFSSKYGFLHRDTCSNMNCAPSKSISTDKRDERLRRPLHIVHPSCSNLVSHSTSCNLILMQYHPCQLRCSCFEW